ncbi:MAG: acetate--CoA ligase [Acidobacteria bacterium]|nr:MAG: acetate--CoA ligase [Acidobacteriota bacterium]
MEALLDEQRRFEPSPEFRADACAADASIYATAQADPQGFWEGFAKQLQWSTPWERVLEGEAPHWRWFVGGKLNASVNCLDRHVQSWRRNKVAILWEGEPGDRRALTYLELHAEVNRCASVLRRLGVQRGDVVAVYLPMIPELVIAMLACARIGAVHSVVFGGFSASALADRIQDAQAKVLITADGGYRRGGVVPLKQAADAAVADCPSIRATVVVRRVDQPVEMQEGRDHWWHDLMQDADAEVPAEEMDSEDMLFILYTSGTTGKPKGIVHTTGGYLTGVYATTRWVFDLKDEDVYWCTADIGWITGHSYIVYGPLAAGATQVMYEGAPDWPDRGRFWEMVERYRVNIFYTAPTAVRAFMKWGSEWPERHDLSSLRLLGTVGEPINPEAWIWYQQTIGGGRCPIVDTWWQTETGHILITPLPGLTTTKPGSVTRPFPGIDAAVLDASGEEVTEGGGLLALRGPWPGMLRGIFGDEQRFLDTYWSRWDGIYFPGDGARVDEDGYFWLLGRVDDVLNVAGHRIGTMEVESALMEHPAVAEAAVVGVPHEVKGQAIGAFVTLCDGVDPSDALADEIRQQVVQSIGAIARPDQLLFAADLPKTRSGKIMRRLLRDIAAGNVLGDTTTLADPSVVEELRQRYEEAG